MLILCVVSQKSFSFWGISSPRLPTGAPPLDPAGGLPSPRPPVFFYASPNNPVRATPLLNAFISQATSSDGVCRQVAFHCAAFTLSGIMFYIVENIYLSIYPPRTASAWMDNVKHWTGVTICSRSAFNSWQKVMRAAVTSVEGG